MTPDIGRLIPDGEPQLTAGNFSAWLIMMDGALAQNSASDVPCGDCTACCQGSYFIQVGADESASLARIPAELLFPAPGAHSGEQLLGYNEQGSCPLFADAACSIYADRPRTCRTYDCRVFAATGLADVTPAKQAIMQRAQGWRFDYADESERTQHLALQQGAAFLLEQADALDGLVPGNATRLAMLVVRLHRVLLEIYENHEHSFPASAEILETLREALREALRVELAG